MRWQRKYRCIRSWRAENSLMWRSRHSLMEKGSQAPDRSQLAHRNAGGNPVGSYRDLEL
jgi:hypothetical protein